MCGIAGIYSLNNSKIPNLKSRVKKMISMMEYRGPDNVGFYFNEKDTFGMSNNQLSIVSPNKKINLPLSYNNRTYLSFNGEIYNYNYLREKYNISDDHFRSKTDTEVLYNILNQGLLNLTDLNGVWSFAFYDKNEHKLQLSRDLLGERNLYCYKNKNELIFSSEIRPIFAANNISFNVDNIGLQDMWKYYACRNQRTLIKNCFKLKPGSTKIYYKGTNKTINHSYLKIEEWIEYFKNKNISQITEKFEKIFKTELEIRYPKKIKSFSLLSGGVDSSIQNLYMGENKKLNTLYAISSDFNFIKRNNLSEMDLSKKISDAIKSNHIFVDLRKNFIKQAMLTSKNSLETLDPCMLNFSMLSSVIKSKKSKVVLASDGPDELLSGYQRDVDNYIINKKDLLRIPYHKILKPKNFYSQIFENIENESNFFSKPDKRYNHIIKNLDILQIKALTYATKSIPEFINIRADKSFMMNSVEIRQPFLSKNLVSFLCAFPTKFRISKNEKFGKMFFRKLLKKKANYKYSYPKIGFGKNLISDEKVFEEMNKIICETIDDKKIISKMNFKKNARDIFLNKTNKSQKFMMFSLIRSLKNLKS